MIPPLSGFYLMYASYYRNTAREVQRLDSISKSPIYAAFSEALNGATTIQAYGANDRFETVNRGKVDHNMRANFISLAANRWLTVRLEFFSNLLLAFTALLAVVMAIGDTSRRRRKRGDGRPRAHLRAWPDRHPLLPHPPVHAARDADGLVERLLAYAKLEPEVTAGAVGGAAAVAALGRDRVPRRADGLPRGAAGRAQGVNLAIAPGEKIGIVGRTGAGKSSILVSLFRIAELRAGAILIDGVDIARVPLPTLRSRLAIIPQDPVLFTGSLRTNIDPTGKYTDAELWMRLGQCGMEGAIAEHQKGLDRPCEERGSNLSMGQRQLLCLCRALLRNARVLVLDEATASVDGESDALIQRTLQTELGSTTVLTIAHRLETVMHCDRILVMVDGRVAESGPPAELQTKQGGRFAELWASRNEQ